MTSDVMDVNDLAIARWFDPTRMAELWHTRRPYESGRPRGRQVLIIAADHAARGALDVGNRRMAVADRRDLLSRLCTALEHPEVDGVLGSPDVLEDLLMLGKLNGKMIFGSMNRGGLRGASFEIDDRYTAYDPSSLSARRLDGGKLLLRIDYNDRATPAALERAANAVTGLTERNLIAMVEPFISTVIDGMVRNKLDTDSVVLSVAVASALGVASSHLWLKLPIAADMARVVAASSSPVVLLGGEVAADQKGMFEAWQRALQLRGVVGIVAGRTLLYPPDDDVHSAVDTASSLLNSVELSTE